MRSRLFNTLAAVSLALCAVSFFAAWAAMGIRDGDRYSRVFVIPSRNAPVVVLDYGVMGVGFASLSACFRFAAGAERRRRGRRVRAGQCPGCGYNLRESRDRCPECGDPVPAAIRRRQAAARRLAWWAQSAR